MGLPAKKRTPRSKRDRASHFALDKKTTSICPACQAAMLPHRACPACGVYRGRQAVNVAKRVARAEKKHKH